MKDNTFRNPYAGLRVLGVGNTLLRDEGVGVKAVEHIIENSILPKEIEVIDGGVGGMRLLPLIKDVDYLIIIDAVKGGGKPGDIYRFTIEDIPLKIKQKTSLHEVNLQEVFSILNLIGEKRPEAVIIGIEPKEIEYGVTLTPEVESVLPEVATKVFEEVEKILISQKMDS